MTLLTKNNISKHWDKFMLAFIICAYIGTLGTLSVLRHNSFASGFDLSNMDQTMWYTLNGHFFSLRDPEEIVSRFSIHADLILVLLSPLYLLKDDVRMLLTAGTVILAFGAIPTYYTSLKLLKLRLVSLVIASAYLLNPGLQWSDMYDFHGVVLAIPFVLFAFYFALTKKWIWYFIFVALALITKEQIALNIAMLGIAVFFYFKQRLIGVATFLVGIVWFFSMVYVVMPYFTPTGAHWALAGHGDSTPTQTFTRIAGSSDLIYIFLFDHHTIQYYKLLLEPFAFLPLLAFPWLLLSGPDLAINVLRDTKTITFHYDSGVTPAIVISTIFSFYYIQKFLAYLKLKKKTRSFVMYGLAGILLLFALRMNYYYSPLPTTPSCWCYIYNVTEEDKEFEKILQAIPKDAVVTSSVEIRPHINHREFVFSVPSATASADFIALITQNRIVGNYEPKDVENRLVPILLSNEDYSLQHKSKHFYLFKRVSD